MKTKPLKIYISLPISGMDYEEVCRTASNAKQKLEQKGHFPISPIDIPPEGEYVEYAECMGEDLKHLLRCDAIVFLKGWEQSKGCQLEKAAARIYNITTFLDMDTVPEALQQQ